MWRYCTEIFDYLSLSAIIDDRVSLLFICFICICVTDYNLLILCNMNKKQSLYVQEFLVRMMAICCFPCYSFYFVRDVYASLTKLPDAPLS